LSPPHTITVNKNEWSYAAAESTNDPDLSVVSEVNRAVGARSTTTWVTSRSPSHTARHLGASCVIVREAGGMDCAFGHVVAGTADADESDGSRMFTVHGS
jgi:hypothetical protein